MNAYVRSNGKIYGPIDFSKVAGACQQGLFSENAEVSEDRIEWLSLDEAQELLKPKSAAMGALPVMPLRESVPSSSIPMAILNPSGDTMGNQVSPLGQQSLAAMPPVGYASPGQQPIFLNSIQAVMFAGFWLRVAACLIDMIILVIMGFCWGYVYGSLFGNDIIFLHIQGYLLSWLYFAVMESSSMQGTIGKQALGIKVTDLSGHPINFAKASGRFFGRILSTLIFGIGMLCVAFTDKKQGLHDMLAGCLVVKR